MKPNEIYSWTPIKEDSCLYGFEKHIAEDINHQPIYVEDGENTRIKVKHYISNMIDDRRGHWMYSVWLDDKPVMICREAGREGDDHTDSCITDKELYWEMIKYIKELIGFDDNNSYYDGNEDYKGLDGFYGIEVKDYYDPNISKPKYEVGDIVSASVIANHLNYEDDRVVTRVRIESVQPFSKHERYFGKQIDREMMKHEDGGWKPIFINNSGEGNLGASFNEEHIECLLIPKAPELPWETKYIPPEPK